MLICLMVLYERGFGNVWLNVLIYGEGDSITACLTLLCRR